MNDYNGNFDANVIPKMKTGADTFLKNISKDFDIKIFTTRNCLLASQWLFENSLNKYVSDVTNVKDTAYLIIDDRCICFDGDFDKLNKQIKNFKVYWK